MSSLIPLVYSSALNANSTASISIDVSYPIWFRICLSGSTKLLSFDCDCAEFIDQLGKFHIFTISVFKTHGHGMFPF